MVTVIISRSSSFSSSCFSVHFVRRKAMCARQARAVREDLEAREAWAWFEVWPSSLHNTNPGDDKHIFESYETQKPPS